jgi:hypothetical protein
MLLLERGYPLAMLYLLTPLFLLGLPLPPAALFP